MFEKESMKTAFQKGDVIQESPREEIVDKIITGNINTGNIYHLDQVKTNQYVISEKQVKEKEKPLVFNKKAIRSGIIFSEILGKPKGW